MGEKASVEGVKASQGRALAEEANVSVKVLAEGANASVKAVVERTNASVKVAVEEANSSVRAADAFQERAFVEAVKDASVMAVLGEMVFDEIVLLRRRVCLVAGDLDLAGRSDQDLEGMEGF